ncbi:alpha/beta hydrolase [Sporosarcina sp. GW1-11]|uniref:alpha/beta hydrolase n=1 Tax=Sporosarcina sp. GW1-11 TaxID=2899126 RepID=UPI00294E4D6D|nr:alpha/beta hydrolase [Sporosarcina sp. GW1-11]MDV6378718.1 alpha/beta hydrolase [Sporosarcina sp. GW1-11]
MSKCVHSYNKKSVEFNAEGITLRGWLYLPDTTESSLPGIVMTHGYGSLKEMYVDKFAEVFASNGFAVLLYDHRNFGDSDGQPRQEINPYEQVLDYQHAITFMSTLEEVDSSRIGVWGSSYSGGHVLMVGAMDKRVRCVVSQVPTISGSESSARRVSSNDVPALLNSFYEDRKTRMQGGEPIRCKIVPEFEGDEGIYSDKDAVDWYLSGGALSPNWKNEVTIRSIELSRSYNPGNYISLIAPTPLLLLVAGDDTVTPTDLQVEAFKDAKEPKKMKVMDGHHFTPYLEHFEVYSNEAIEWFKEHL